MRMLIVTLWLILLGLVCALNGCAQFIVDPKTGEVSYGRLGNQQISATYEERIDAETGDKIRKATFDQNAEHDFVEGIKWGIELGVRGATPP